MTIEEIEEKLNVGINLANDIQKFLTDQDCIARAEERERCIQIAQKLLCEKCLGNNECSICGDYGAPSATGWMCTKRLLIRKAIEEGGEQ